MIVFISSTIIHVFLNVIVMVLLWLICVPCNNVHLCCVLFQTLFIHKLQFVPSFWHLNTDNRRSQTAFWCCSCIINFLQTIKTGKPLTLSYCYIKDDTSKAYMEAFLFLYKYKSEYFLLEKRELNQKMLCMSFLAFYSYGAASTAAST